jgi:hypothetical protein
VEWLAEALRWQEKEPGTLGADHESVLGLPEEKDKRLKKDGADLDWKTCLTGMIR